MNDPHKKLAALLEAARAPQETADLAECDALPPGLAARIAGNWAAAPATRESSWWWERLSYAGLASALVVAAAVHFSNDGSRAFATPATLTDWLEADLNASPDV